MKTARHLLRRSAGRLAALLLLAFACAASAGAPPGVNSINPNFSQTSGDLFVTLNGSGFTGATQVTFGGKPASGVTVHSDTKITAFTPAHGAGSVAVGVTTPEGTFLSATPGFFTYVGPIVVTTTSDTPAVGQTTLREAITLANDLPDEDRIIFGSGAVGTIQLTSALPDLTGSLKIIGPGANVLAVRGQGAANRYRILTIPAGATVEISGLTVTNGYTADGANGGLGGTGVPGGGIFNSGTLHLARVAVSGNQTGKGGDGSSAPGGGGGAGGGIFNSNGAHLDHHRQHHQWQPDGPGWHW
jgi:CSLREA domain-containing protein